MKNIAICFYRYVVVNFQHRLTGLNLFIDRWLMIERKINRNYLITYLSSLNTITKRVTSMNIVKKTISIGLFSAILLACTPEIGSEQWCKDMKEKPKTDWTANAATDFAKHCIFK